MTQPLLAADAEVAERIARGRHSEACLAIGAANLSTLLLAEQQVSDELAIARSHGEPHRGYLGRLMLVRARRRRLQGEAQDRARSVCLESRFPNARGRVHT